MANVASYHVLVYGGPDGYQTNRSQISLYDAAGKTVAFVRFNDPGMAFESDSESGGIIKMHLPSTMFQSVLDVLRRQRDSAGKVRPLISGSPPGTSHPPRRAEGDQTTPSRA